MREKGRDWPLGGWELGRGEGGLCVCVGERGGLHKVMEEEERRRKIIAGAAERAAKVCQNLCRNVHIKV